MNLLLPGEGRGPVRRKKLDPGLRRGALLAALLAFSAPAIAQTVAITGGTVALGDGSEPIEGGTVVIRGGRIVAAGRGVAVPGATTALVTPPARLTWIAVARGLIAGATSIAALNGELPALTSLVAATASTSIRPIREKPATIPGVTHLPVASTRWASAGIATLRPAATIRPLRITTVPFGIGAPAMGTTVALRMA